MIFIDLFTLQSEKISTASWRFAFMEDLIIERFSMQKGLLSAIAIAIGIAVTLSAGAALSADLASRQPPSVYFGPLPVNTWTGFYAGLNLGGGWSANSSNNNNWTPYTDLTYSGSANNFFLYPGSTNGGSNAGGVVGGGQIGYNYQFGNSFVVGAETDIQGTSMSSGGNNVATTYPSPLTGNLLTPLDPYGNIGVSLNWFGTVRGRVGYLITPTILAYGTAGFAYGGVSGNVTGYSNTRTGWTGGGGLEWKFAPNWTVKLEYLFVNLDSGGTTGDYTGYQYGAIPHPQVNIVRAGVNYIFNFARPDPVVARY